jgi:hypothetical protein
MNFFFSDTEENLIFFSNTGGILSMMKDIIVMKNCHNYANVMIILLNF